MPGAGLDCAAQSLRGWLNGLHFTDLAAPEVTRFFTTSVDQWGLSLGYHARHEAALPAQGQRTGYLDVRLTHHSGAGRPISIEIDRGNKRWSLEKLIHAAELGDFAVWLRWGREPVPLTIPPAVRLIRAHVSRCPAAGRSKRFCLQPDNCG